MNIVIFYSWKTVW